MKKLRLVFLTALALATTAFTPWSTSRYDEFTRANAGNLGGQWTQTSDTITLASNQASLGGASLFGTANYTAGITWSANQYSEITLTSTLSLGAAIELTVRINGSSGYSLSCDGTSMYVYRWDDDSTVVGPSVVALASGDRLRFQVIGSAFTVLKNGASVMTGSDSTFLSGGSPGFNIYTGASVTVTGDNWRGGTP